MCCTGTTHTGTSHTGQCVMCQCVMCQCVVCTVCVRCGVSSNTCILAIIDVWLPGPFWFTIFFSSTGFLMLDMQTTTRCTICKSMESCACVCMSVCPCTCVTCMCGECGECVIV